MKIKKVPGHRIQPPGFAFDVFTKNPDLWGRLKDGEIIDVPEEVAKAMTGVEIVVEKKVEVKKEEKNA